MSDLISRSALIKVLKDRATNEAIMGYMTAYDVTNSIIDEVEEQPTAFDADKVILGLEKELSLADKEKERCVGENNLQFDSAKGYASGISTAIEIVKQGGVSDDACESSADKIKVTSLEVIVTGKREKPYYEIKYKEVGEIDYKIGYSSYDLNNVFAWRDEFFEIVNRK